MTGGDGLVTRMGGGLGGCGGRGRGRSFNMVDIFLLGIESRIESWCGFDRRAGARDHILELLKEG